MLQCRVRRWETGFKYSVRGLGESLLGEHKPHPHAGQGAASSSLGCLECKVVSYYLGTQHLPSTVPVQYSPAAMWKIAAWACHRWETEAPVGKGTCLPGGIQALSKISTSSVALQVKGRGERFTCKCRDTPLSLP